jgi:phenylacetate-CoA ligase
MLFMPEAEAMSREKLKEVQLERLIKTLEHIQRNNPFYFNHFNGLTAKDVKSLEDVQKFPFLTKEDLRKGYPFKWACAPQSAFVRMHMSSGTTGTPVINPMTAADVKQWGEIMARCLVAAGLTSADVLQITPSFGLFNGGFGFHYGAERLGAMIIPIGPGRSELQLKFIKELGTTAIAGIASYPLRLIEVAKKIGFDFHQTKLRVGIFGAEVWSDEMRQKIEKEMGISSFDIIGMTETGGVGLGIDCEYKNGIHVWEDHYLIEIIDPKTGELLPDGQEGEMVVTTLTREGLPLIRYRTGDITAILSRETCKCGRTMLRIKRIKGRTDDMIVIKGVNFYPKQIESLIMGLEGAYGQYQIILKKIEGKDYMLLQVEYEGERPKEFKEKLHKKIYDFLGFNVDIEILSVGSLPRQPGKAVRVIDERNK